MVGCQDASRVTCGYGTGVVARARTADAAATVVKQAPEPLRDVTKVAQEFHTLPTHPEDGPKKVVYADFLGASACKNCHQKTYELWRGSSHGIAGGAPNAQTVVAPFSGVPMTFSDAVVTPRKIGGRYVFEVKTPKAALERVDVAAVVGRGLMKGGAHRSLSKGDDGHT